MKNKNTQANEYQIDALLTKIMDNEASRAYIETCQNQEMAYITNRRLFENAFEIAAKVSFSSTAKISLKLSSKNKRLPTWWNWQENKN